MYIIVLSEMGFSVWCDCDCDHDCDCAIPLDEMSRCNLFLLDFWEATKSKNLFVGSGTQWIAWMV